MVLDMANLKNRKSTIQLGMRGRDAVRKSTPKVNFTGVHDRFLRDPVYRESQLAFGWTEQKVQRVGRTCKRRPYISSHSRGTEKIPRTMVSHPKQIMQKMGPMKLRSDFSSCCLYEKSSTPRVRRTSWRAYFTRTIQNVASLFKHVVVGQIWMELEVSS